MQTHKDVFARYCQTAHREHGKTVENWRDWLSAQGLAQCDNCKEYGAYADEVGHIADDAVLNPGVRIEGTYCRSCQVDAWGWTWNGTMLSVTCVRGHEVDALTAQAAYFGDASGLQEWGYDGCKSHVHFNKGGSR